MRKRLEETAPVRALGSSFVLWDSKSVLAYPALPCRANAVPCGTGCASTSPAMLKLEQTRFASLQIPNKMLDDIPLYLYFKAFRRPKTPDF